MDRTNKIPREDRDLLEDTYLETLLGDIEPFWTRNSPDRRYGGFYSCLDHQGKAYTKDKFVWMLCRQTWMLTHLHRTLMNRPDWLQLAQGCAEFILKHAATEDGGFYFRLTRDGKPRARCLSLYTECFAAMALAELGGAVGQLGWWQRAMLIWKNLQDRLGRPEDTPMLGYPMEVRFHLHAHDMMRLTLTRCFNQLSPSDRWDRWIDHSVKTLLASHWKPELGALLENVSPDGQPLLDIPEGRMVHPGHALESAWMLMEVALERDDGALWDKALAITLTTLDRGWDREAGGIRYLVNIDGTPTHALEADLRLWWVHAEALYTLLLAWAISGRDDIRRWYEAIHDYAFDRFPDAEHGEWYGYLNRDGSPVWTAKGNGWKGFFHLPRAMLKCYALVRLPDSPRPSSVFPRPAEVEWD